MKAIVGCLEFLVYSINASAFDPQASRLAVDFAGISIPYAYGVCVFAWPTVVFEVGFSASKLLIQIQVYSAYCFAYTIQHSHLEDVSLYSFPFYSMYLSHNSQDMLHSFVTA